MTVRESAEVYNQSSTSLLCFYCKNAHLDEDIKWKTTAVYYSLIFFSMVSFSLILTCHILLGKKNQTKTNNKTNQTKNTQQQQNKTTTKQNINQTKPPQTIKPKPPWITFLRWGPQSKGMIASDPIAIIYIWDDAYLRRLSQDLLDIHVHRGVFVVEIKFL